MTRRITLEWLVSDIGSETISVILSPTTAQGTVVQFGGSWSGVKPSVLEYSTDVGLSWTAASNFSAEDDFTLGGRGPLADTVGTLTILFRDRDRQNVTSTTSTVVISSAQTLTLSPIPNGVINTPVTIAGTWTGTMPSGLEWDTGTGVWTSVASFVANAGGTWTGLGNTPTAPGSITLRVRRTDQTDIVSNAATYTASLPDSITLDVPTGVVVGANVALSGAWSGTKPASLQYSTNGGSTWPASLTSFQTTDSGNSSGTWTGTGPTFTTGGTFFLRVRNATKTSVVSSSVQITVSAPTVTVNVPASVTAGTAFALTGGWGVTQPSAMDYSINGGTTWVAIGSFSSSTANRGSWSGTGPTPSVAGNTSILVRDHNATSVQDGPVIGVATSGAVDALTINTPNSVVTGTAFALSGTWTNTKPTAMDYTTNNGSTWVAITSFATTGTTGTGGWSGNGPTPSVAGTTSIKVRNNGATSVQSTTVNGVAILATITLNDPGTIPLGSAVPFSGTWTGNQPTAIDYSPDTVAWTALVTPTINAGGTWSATGPVESAAGTFNYTVRDHDHTSVVSAQQSVVVVNTEVITLNTPASVTVNNPILLSGGWSGVRPGTSLVYTTDNFATAPHATTSYTRTADNSNHVGTWSATGPTPTSAGNLSIRVMDNGNPLAKSNTVTAVVTVAVPPPAISVSGPSSIIVGNPIQLTGTWTTNQPAALDYTTDGGSNWSPVTVYVPSGGGTWSGTGPTPTATGVITLQVRDHTATGVLSGNISITVAAAPPPPSLTIAPPAAVTQGSTVALSGTWVTTKPTAMDYTLDNGATWVAIGSFAATGTASPGGWSGNGPTPGSAGTLSIKVRDHNATSVQAGPVSETVNPTGGGGGTQAVKTSTFLNSLGINTHTGLPAYGGNDNGAKIIGAMNNIGIKRLRDGVFGTTTFYNNLDANGIGGCYYPPSPSTGPASIDARISFAKSHKVLAFEGTNEWNIFTISYTTGGITYTDAKFPDAGPYGQCQATAHWELDLYNAANADAATRNIPIYNATLGTGKTLAWNAFRDTPGLGHDWIDRADFGNVHVYTPNSQLNFEQALPDHISTDQLNYLNYDKSKCLIPMPNPHGIVTTEWGFSTNSGLATGSSITTAAQAKMIWLNWVAMFQFGYLDMYLYELFDTGTDGTIGNSWGIHTNDGTMKPAAQVLKNVYSILTDNGSQTFTPGTLNYSFTNMPIGATGAGQGKSILLQSSNGTKWIIPFVNLVIWPFNGTAMATNPTTTVTLNLTTPATLTTYDPLIGTAAQGTSGTAVTSYNFGLNDTPLIIKVS
jgi:hypothetical protein